MSVYWGLHLGVSPKSSPVIRDDWTMSSTSVLTDGQWDRIQPLLPSSAGCRGRPFRDDRRVVEGMIYRYQHDLAWRDLPAEFGPWQTVWKRENRYRSDGTWGRIFTELLGGPEPLWPSG
ncbi:transposase [Arthrobacter terricola]|uniref:Transposase n=1 Tax=Arthrobacter terricola TaxID=2547396 RepID=A0A4R5KDV1_9MICC|nr:transposase [Arthrobacter terricola]